LFYLLTLQTIFVAFPFYKVSLKIASTFAIPGKSEKILACEKIGVFDFLILRLTFSAFVQKAEK
jgi:hypothetical protein